MEPSKIGKVSRGNSIPGPLGWGEGCLAVGFSARALADALGEAGFRVIAVDAFGDYDTRETAKVPQIIQNWGAVGAELSLQIEYWPFYSEILRELDSAGPLPVFLAGGCENWSDFLENLHSQACFKVLGPTVNEMRKLRDPSNWRCVAERSSGRLIRFPTSRTVVPSDSSSLTSFSQPFQPSSPISSTDQFPEPFTDPKWLLKRTASSGGLGVSSVPDNSMAGLPEGCYWQRRIDGRSIGASCLVTATDTGVDVQFVGATDSWQPSDWPGATEFIYRGSFGPIELTAPQQQAICQATKNLISDYSPNLIGWMQLDFIEEPNGQLWLLEINPRWTAGMEVLRLSGRANLAALHAQAHGLTLFSKSAISVIARQWSKFVGKAIYYPSSDVRVTPRLLARLHQLMGQGFSDIPSVESAGTLIPAGHPLLTISAEVSRQSHSEASGRQAVLDELYRKRTFFEQLLS